MTNHEPDEPIVGMPPGATSEAVTSEAVTSEAATSETETPDPATGTTQLSRILMAGDLSAEVVSPTEARDSRVMWRWALGVAVVVVALAIVASVIVVRNINPIVKTAGCDVMSRSTSCAPQSE